MSNPRTVKLDTDGGNATVAYASGTVTGSISLSATLTTTVGSGSSSAKPYVSVTNDGLFPDGTVLAQLNLNVPAVNLASLIGASANDTVTQNSVTIYPKSDGTTTLTLHFNGATAATAIFTGS